MIVYLARDIQAFVMYCVNGTSRSSLLIESTDSMIIVYHAMGIFEGINFCRDLCLYTRKCYSIGRAKVSST